MKNIYIVYLMMILIINNNSVIGKVPVQNELELFLYTNEKTQKQLEIEYQNEEDLTKVISLLEEIPPEIVDCVDKLVLYDNEVEENVAGVSKDRTIKLYDFSSYCVATQKHIIYHEFAHIWGNKLMQYKVLDYHYTDYVETVVLLSKGEVDSKKIRVEFSLEDMDMSEFQDGATYTQIKDYVLEHSGLKVSNLYISQIKRKCGIEVGKNYNLPKSEDSRQPLCPPEKEKAIREAFKYFGII